MAGVNKQEVAWVAVAMVSILVMCLWIMAVVKEPEPVAVVEVKASKSVACYLNESLITSFTDMDSIYISPQGGTLYFESGEQRAVYRLRSGEVCATDDGKIHKGEQPLHAEEEEAYH